MSDTELVVDAADTVEARLGAATIAQLREMARGGIGEPATQIVRDRLDGDTE